MKKKMTALRRGTALLTALLVLAAALCGCAETDAPDAAPTQEATGTPTVTALPTEKEKITPAEVLANFSAEGIDGREYTVAASSSFENTIFITQFPESHEDKNGDAVNDALFDRDALLEEYFGIDVVYADIMDSRMFDKTSASIRVGDDAYSMILGTLEYTAIKLFNNHLVMDLYDVDHIDLEKPWWNRNSIDNFEVNGKIYLATGAATNRYVYSPYAMLFNQRLLTDADLQSPYVLVANNEWTLENFAAMIEDRARELNGNDKLDMEDFYGLAPADDSQTAYYFAAGGTLISKTADGGLVKSYYDGDNLDLLDYVTEILTGEDVLVYKDTYDPVAVFRDGRAIFHSMALGDITLLTTMEDYYGIVPMPKYSTEQEEYVSNANKYISTFVTVPISVEDVEYVGRVTEALSAVSQYTSLDTQYETVLLNRQATDAESKNNLITVVESISYDWGYVCDLGGIAKLFYETIRYGTDYSSSLASIRDKLDARLEELLALFED